MSDFLAAYQISRTRFEDEVKGLTQEQLNWRMQPDAMTIGEAAMHVAGAEVNFISQLLGLPLDAYAERLKKAATDGVVNDEPVPFSASEIAPSLVADALAFGRAMAEPIISDPRDEIRAVVIKSVLGPMIDGTGALARLAFHPAYHQGQIYLMKQSPGFPK
ncbi:MAG: DinB family protein [Fimbriimonadales bacterium]